MSADESPEPQELPEEMRGCRACRETGKVTSNLGGSPSQVDCPWCDGTGAFIPGHDAQAVKRAELDESS